MNIKTWPISRHVILPNEPLLVSSGSSVQIRHNHKEIVLVRISKSDPAIPCLQILHALIRIAHVRLDLTRKLEDELGNK
jgi:hypothetical protein